MAHSIRQLTHLQQRIAAGNSSIKGLRFQAGSKLGAEVVGRLVQFVLIYTAQRLLGPANYGVITYGLAVGTVLAPATDLGMQLIITREVARAERLAPRVSGTGLVLKLLLTIVAVFVLLPISWQRPTGTVFATFALGAAVIGGSFAEYFGYVFRGVRRVELDALLTLLLRLSVFGFGFAALLLRLSVNGVASAYLIGNGLAAVLGYVWLRRRFFKPILIARKSTSAALLHQALPLGGAILFSIAYTRTAVFLLDALNNAAAVGEYGVALRLTEPLAMIPAALLAAVFPALTHAMALTGYTSTRALRFKTIAVLALAGSLIALGGVLLGPWVIHVLYGAQYAGSTLPLQLLALATLPIFINYALTHFLVARRQQRLNLLFNAVIFVVNLVLCSVLIPRLGTGGAALSTLLSEVTLLTLCSIALAR